MIKRKAIFIFVLLLLAPVFALANPCTVLIGRTCKAGKSCRTFETRTEIVKSPEECLNTAKQSCPVYFPDSISKKQVKVKFGENVLMNNPNICD